MLNGAVVISPSEKTLPAALNFEIIKTLQTVIEPNVFTPRGVYDGRKNMFSPKRFSFGDTGEVGFICTVPFFWLLTNTLASVLCLSCDPVGSAASINRR